MKTRDNDNKIERRMVSAPVEIETREDGTIGSIHGYAIVYNKDSEDMGFVERVAPGASKKALNRSDVRGLKNHDPSLIFARQGVNLKLTEDKNGLRYDATPIDTRNFKEIAEEVRTGLLTGQSFGFTILADEWKDLDTDHPKRTITEIGEIFDVGPVTYPAYPDTNVGLRTLEAAREASKETIPDDKKDYELVFRKDDGSESYYTFDDKEDFDRFEKDFDDWVIKKHKRSDANPTVPATDVTVPDPTIDEEPEARDNTLEKIEQLTARFVK